MEGGLSNKWFTAVWQVVLEESVVQETSQEAFRVGCWGWREVKMVRISERWVRLRHLLDKGLEESERKGSVGGLKGSGGRSIPGDMGSAVRGSRNSCLVWVLL